jgi:hypothetical protein
VHARYMRLTGRAQATHKSGTGGVRTQPPCVLVLFSGAGFGSIPGGTWLKLDRWLDRPHARW